MNGRPRVLIVGAGLCGLAAAAVLARGCEVTMIDEGVQAGGQYLKRPASVRIRMPGKSRGSLFALGISMIDRIASSDTRMISGAQVVGADDEGRLWVETSDGRLLEMRADAVLFATGARERFIPFNGWTLPGVVSTGAAQILLKTSGSPPAGCMVAAGCGPLPLAVAAEISSAGGRIQGLIDQTPLLAAGKVFFRLAAYPSKLVEACKNLFLTVAAGVRLHPGSAVIEAGGDGILEEVVYCSLDRAGGPVPGSEKVVRTGCLAVGHGFAPNVELAQVAGCRLSFDPDARSWVVEVDECMRTSLPGIYAAGEITGVAGARKSFIEGSIAGLSMAKDLGAGGGPANEQKMRLLKKSREREVSFGRLMNRLSAPSKGILENIKDCTVLCRCEDVTMGEIRSGLADGALTPGAVKRATRCGMGMCQGRTCGPVLQDLISIQPGSGGPAPPFSSRIPVKPVDARSFPGTVEGYRS